MVPQNALTGLYLALHESPMDGVTLRALADFFEETGDADRSECVRWTILRGLAPFRFWKGRSGLQRESLDWHDGWFWWASGAQELGTSWGFPGSCRLPEPLWTRMVHSFPYTPAVFKEYPTIEDAYEALFMVWPLFASSEMRKSRLERLR